MRRNVSPEPGPEPGPEPSFKLGLVAVVTTLVVLVGGIALGQQDPDARDDSRPASPSGGRGAAPVTHPALDVFTTWQRRRARAWEAGSIPALRRLYVDHAAARPDVRMLRTYQRRNLRVVGMRSQVLAYRVVDQSGERIRLEVTERMSAGEIRGASVRRPLPRDRPDQRLITLVHKGARWQVARIE